MQTTSIIKKSLPLLVGIVALALAGCQLVQERLHAAGYFATTQAGYAGRFRLAHGR